MLSHRYYSRRAFLRVFGMGAGGAILAACTPGGTRLLSPSASPSATGTVTSPVPTTNDQATVIVGDVLDFELRGPFEWNGGSVTMRLHEALANGEPAYFVRTDASDATFAEAERLVFVPLLAAAASVDGGIGDIYLFDEGSADQRPVISWVPDDPGFTPLFRVHRVRASDELLDSVDAIRSAADAGRIEVEDTEVVVNYPLVKWAGGELPVDPEVKLPLANGPLLAAPDTERGEVVFKLHQCYPESRYIITDTSAVPMAPMMSVVGSPGTEGLIEAGATSKITVFGNGIPGPGAMGFQPAIFGAKAGDPAWSPIWDHWTAVWNDEADATLLATQAEIDAAEADGLITLHHGTPDTGGMGFAVNCPSPIVAPNDFEVA
ncbi:MAG: hypothetical protein LC798_06950 [Chloroflexi bacterium]|nr:hypothetical protein [Chloroflexota bacterium]